LQPAVRRFYRIAGAEIPDVVFATGGPWTALLVGEALAKKFRVPFVADFRDPWTDNPHMKDHPKAILHKAKRVERSVYESAARVIANTPELCDKLRTDHPDLRGKFLTITNGFDGETWLPGTDPCADGGSGPSCFGQRDLIELCHFGTVYGNRSPVALLQALKELVDNKQIAPDQLRIRFVGVWEVTDPSCEKLARDLEQRGMIRREPPVAHDHCVQLMRKAKVLLLLQPAYPLQIPGKIYEYIATGRPLLVIGGEGATANLVEKNQLGICCPNQVADIKTTLSRLVARKLRIAPPRKEMRECFEYRALAGNLASVLDDVCAKPSQ
jgi:glycosyltransferase involved in cell wall biosynthesis